MKKYPFILATSLLLVLSFVPPLALADDAPAAPDFYEMSLEQLLEVPVTVASAKATSQRRSPAIVTVITEEEIRTSGARDLMDLLERVPGLHFAQDVSGVVSLGIRGNWAAEAKFLFLIDGIEMNENLFGGVPFGNHYPVEHLRKIEIIRGPGSALYGGQAELAVIHLHTKAAADLNGMEASIAYGQNDRSHARRNVSVQYGKKMENSEFSAKLLAGQGNRSDRDYTDSLGETISLARESALNPTHVNIGWTWKDLQTRLIVDHYSMTGRDAYGENLPYTVPTDFRTYGASVLYPIQLTPSLKLTPELRANFQEPWRAVDAATYTPAVDYDRTAARYSAKNILDWTINDDMSGRLGIESFQDIGTARGEAFSSGAHQVVYYNIASFAEFSGSNQLLDWTVGARFNWHSRFHSNFVPRLSVSKSLGDVHAKLLFSKAFKAPTIENLDRNPAIKPEVTTVAEAELGWKASPEIYLVANAYHLHTVDPIAYQFIGTDSYANYPGSGSKGLELEARWRPTWGQLTLNYSFYTRSANTVPLYIVPGNDTQHLAFPGHKATFNALVKFSENWSLNNTWMYYGERTGYVYDGTQMSAHTFSDQVTTHLFVNRKDVLTPGLSLGGGVFNLLGAASLFLQPYFNDSTTAVNHPPLPNGGREYFLRADYKVAF